MNLFTPTFTPKNQNELVIYTLIEHRRSGFELSLLTWMQEYKSAKWSTRLGEVEAITGKKLVERKTKQFVNRFGHLGYYVVYIPILEEKEYLQCLNILRKNGKFVDENKVQKQ